MTLDNKCKPERLLDICPHCKGFVDIIMDMKNGVYLDDAYARKIRENKKRYKVGTK